MTGSSSVMFWYMFAHCILLWVCMIVGTDAYDINCKWAFNFSLSLCWNQMLRPLFANADILVVFGYCSFNFSSAWLEGCCRGTC